MHSLSFEFANLMAAFAYCFCVPVFQPVQVRLIGAMFATGKRTVSAALRVIGLSQEQHFQNAHRVLNRAVWSNLGTSRILLTLLLATFAPTGLLVMGLDDTHID